MSIDGSSPILYVVATPIGNLADFSQRGIDTLRACDLVLAEDTRVSRRLLQAFAIDTPMQALHEHNERALAPRILTRMLEAGLRVALISDAGMPVISDPGFQLVTQAWARGVRVSVVPGPNAAVAALAIAGIPAAEFTFAGFLPPRSAARRARLEALSGLPHALVLYEAPHRLQALIADARQTLGEDRLVCVARELTKLHETLYRGTLGEVQAQLLADEHADRGELVLVIGPAPASAADDAALERQLRAALRYLGPGEASALVSEITGARRNKLYRMCLDLSPATGQTDAQVSRPGNRRP